MSELRVLRERLQAAGEDLDRAVGNDTFGSPALIVKTTTIDTYPTTAATFYACLSQQLTGTEDEGDTPTYTADDGTLFALNLGTKIPPSGTTLIVHSVGGRWVFRYDVT